MQRQPDSIYGQAYQDQTIDPLQLFRVPDQQFIKSRKTEKLPQKFTPPINLASSPFSKTENNLCQRYKTLTQRSDTEQSIGECPGFRKKLRVSSANIGNIVRERERIQEWKMELSRKKKDKRPELREIVRRHKITNIVRNFVVKIKRNNPFASVVQLEENQEGQSFKWLSFPGVQLGQQLQRAFDIVFLVINFFSIYFYTLGLAFNINQLQWSINLERCLLFAFTSEFLLGCLADKCIAGKWITTFKQIVRCYFGESMMIDLWMIAMLSIQICGGNTEYLKLALLLKLPHLLEKLEKLQIHCIATSYRQQYWSLAKLFLFNFCFAHLLALALRFMANISPHQNWMSIKGISSAPWFQAYIWSYYWAINIMLTVGFGDIVATNYQEALCLIFIETFSCMVLAYNINCVGGLISNIRGQDLQKSRKYRIFRGLADKHGISSELSLRIGNYIEQSNNIKKKFNIEDENKFIDTLPRIFKKDYLKQANKRIFQKIFFFTNLADRAVQALAQVIEVSITHPEELIVNPQTYMALKILKEGRMGYCCRKMGSIYNGRVIDQISVAEGEAPVLLGVEFITHRRPTFQIKSMEYSIIYGLTYDRLIQSLKKSRGDYEYFCFLRDKAKYQIDQFQIYQCPNCKTKHTRFLCPKLHFIPIRQQVINRALHTQRISKCNRISMERKESNDFHPLRHFASVNEIPFGGHLSISTMSKNKGFIVNQLMKDVKRINTDLSHQGTLFNFNYPMVFLNNTAQSIKQELAHFLRRENEEDQVWTIALDCMQNYKNYFPKDNAGELAIRLGGETNPRFAAMSSQDNKNSFIVYHHQKEKTLREGTYVQRMEHAMRTQTINTQSAQEYLSTLEQL